jgi:hypothetical protein
LKLTFIIEAIYPIDRRTLVVSPEEKEVLRILNLVGEQEAYRFKRLFTSVNIVAQE